MKSYSTKRFVNSLIDYLAFVIIGYFTRWIISGTVGVNPLVILGFSLFISLSMVVARLYRVHETGFSSELAFRTGIVGVVDILIGMVAVGFFADDVYGDHRWIFLFYCFCCCWFIGTRFLNRHMKTRATASGRPRAVIYGAGEVGQTMVRVSTKTTSKDLFNYKVVGFVDDNPELKGEIVMGVPVLGNSSDLDRVLSKENVSTLIVAIHSITSEKMQHIAESAAKAGVQTKIVPNLFESRNGSDLSVRDIDISDLLGRSLIETDKKPLFEMFTGKTILVTGAGGSIGSEICRQLMDFGLERLILLDIDETELHDTCLRILDYAAEWTEKVVPVVCDIRNAEKVAQVFAKYRPDIVFHAAAYKHVPLMELYPEEAVITNVCGSYNVFKAAIASAVKRVVVISTDKAVNPTNVMGCTKRIVEKMASALNCQDTEFCCVRFGNVIGSRGSMLPLFLNQIREGKPITVTDERIIRYFMAIPEAVSLVFKAASIAKGGEVMVLDMGQPVRIYDFAQKLVKIFGDGRSYVKVTGLRPGEKLYEELLANKDNTIPTDDSKVFRAKVEKDDTFNPQTLEEEVAKLPSMTPDQLVALLQDIVPEFKRAINKKA